MGKKKLQKQKRSVCAVSMALDAIGDRWSLLILRDLMFSNKRSYGELKDSDENIATNILAARLVALEANGLITKQMNPDDNRRNLYYLTMKGIDLVPVVVELMHWMNKYNTAANVCAENKKAYKKDRKSLYEKIISDLKKSHLPKPKHNQF